MNDYWRKYPIREFNVEQTMYSLVTNAAKGNLDLEAVGFMGNSMNYSELFESANALAKSFRAIGIREGDNIVILTINMPLVQQCLLSLSKIGATMSWIDLRAQENDLIRYVNTCHSKAVVIFEDLLPLIEKIADDLASVEKIIVCSPKQYLNSLVRAFAQMKDVKEGKSIKMPSDDRFISLPEFIKGGKHTVDVSTANYKKDRPSLIVQSSGSTGKAKLIVHTERNFNSQVQKMAYMDFPLYKGNTMFVAVPPFIIYGLATSVYTCLAFTMKAEMCPFVDENIVYKGLGTFDISFAVPLHYRYIYTQLLQLQRDIDKPSSPKEQKKKLKEYRRVQEGLKRAVLFGSGGDKIGAEELIEMQQAFDTPIANGFGNNECLGPTIVTPMYVNKPGTVGIPLHDVNFKLVNPDTGEVVNIGETGELYVSSDNMFVEYLNSPEETNTIKITDRDGKQWVKTGDLCAMDSDGFITPMGRSRRLIIRGGFKIAPDTIEDVIISLPFVKECVVVGVADEKFGSVPMAFVELNTDTNIEGVYEIIRKKCEKALPEYEIPSYFEQIAEIPYTPNGKHDFRKLENLGNSIVSKLAELQVK